LTASNGIIPNQVHTREMAKILQNAENYLPFLNEKDESGLTVSQRILKLFTFQIPYYVGPVSPKSEQNGGNGWVVRKADGKVLPWNIDEKIDLKATSERFIERLIRNCTYISDEKVLPKASLEYEAFCVLNEINNLKIDGEKIPVELKQEIYRRLFQRGKKVTKKQLVNFLSCKGILKEEAQLSGIDNEINNSLSTYGKFKAIFGEKLEEDECRHMVEDIVRWCTIYGDSKSFLKEQLEERYADKISSENMKRIFGFKFKDWGRLSKEFLELSACDKSTGERVSLIRTMWDTNYNLMELLHSEKYTFDEALKEKQKKGIRLLQEMEPEDLDELYFSAPVKRMIWQTILIIREIEKVLGSSPKRLFIEMTRSNEEKGDKGRKDSRKNQLLDLYKNIKDESRDWKAEIEAADQKGWLRSKKVYLYYTQMGRCMYSGQPIDFEALMNDNIYDIDHIYPRHFVKDDNINNNLVLVDKRLNAHKSDTYPLEASIRSSAANIALWKRLLDVGLILPEKYRRLTGREAFTDEQKAGFIARQLVETSQGTKGVSDILKEMLPETEIVYSKASNVSEFRHQRGLQKSRLVNDFHHAHDAYLNIVVGNVYYVKFTKNPINFIRNEYARDAKTFNYNLSKMFDWDVARGEEIAWKAQTEEGAGTIVTVKKMLAKNTPLLTRFSFEGHGAIANETLYGASKAKKDGYIPLKSSDERMLDVTKYGGFTSASTAYFFLVEHEIKGKKVRTLETVPVYEKDKIAQEPEELQRYCEQTLGLIHPSVRISRIKIQSLMRINGYNVHISGKTGNQIAVRNAVSMCLAQNWIDYIHLLEKYREKQDLDEKITAEENIRLYDILTEKHTKAIYQKRLNPIGKKLIDAREKFEQLTVEKQSLVLLQILQATQIGIAVADLTVIGSAAKSGVMLFGKRITDFSECKLINQSVTGLFESSVDLLTV
jgi:CRISPR-associated endonuclease Csn1